MPNFTHLHVHTQYSILDGASRIPILLKKAKNLGMEAMAITDHGAMFGAYDFQTQANALGIKPIIGCEVYVARGSRHQKQGKEDQSAYHLILLAKNQEGYFNLCRLNSIAFREGFYYRPRIDREALEQYSEGLICCSACLGGEIPRLILNGQIESAEAAILEHKRIFGSDYYIELQNHGLDDQATANRTLIDLARKHEIKLIASNDIHYVEADDFEAHRILVCLNTGRKLHEYTSMSYTGQEYLKSAEEMTALFPDCPEAISNTQEIVDKIQDFSIKREVILPKFPLPDGFESEMAYLRHLTHEGSLQRWGTDVPQATRDRLDFELATVEKMGFPGYFLIVWDFIHQAKKIGVMVGPGRGSAAGSAIAYAIGITNVDPIKYKLLFERFLNPDRISMPDVDIDFDDAGRERVIQYVVGKYGSDRVAQIITFGSMATKSAIKDVARVLDLPLSESDRISKLVPDKVKNLEEAMQKEPLLRQELDSPNPLIRETLRYASALEGSLRSTGTHACGMIIAPEDLQNIVPLSTAKNTDMPVVQFEGSCVEDAGFLKMDFLGLSTLNIIKNTLESIREKHQIDIDIDNIPLDDPETYALFCRGDTFGIFQFESPNMRAHMMELKPDRFEDLIAMNALYRPGPMEKIPNYIRRKFGTEEVAYDFPEMEEELRETYGITVYQEQVMLLSQRLANFTKGEADNLRKAMGKKKVDVIAKMEPKFLEGCGKNGYKKETCLKIWSEWVKFAEYAFNKSHSTCYAFIAYQTAYLKAHYPAEYMASALSNDLGDITKLGALMEECKRMQLPLLGPDINESQVSFTVNTRNEIRFGMAAIKGVGIGAVEAILEEKKLNGPFVSISDFLKRVDLRRVNKRCIDNLARAGAFDGFNEIHRAQFFYQYPDSQTYLDKLINFGSKLQQSESLAQASLFGEEETNEMTNMPEAPLCPPWPRLVKLREEKSVTGIYISGHPLTDFEIERNSFANAQISMIVDQAANPPLNTEYRFIAMVGSAQHLTSKKGTRYGRLILEDQSGSYEVNLFKDDYLKYTHFLAEGVFVFVKASFQQRFRDAKQLEFRVLSIENLESFLEHHAKNITIYVDLMQITAEWIAHLTQIAQENKGNCSVSFVINHNSSEQSLSMTSSSLRIHPETFSKALQEWDRHLKFRVS